LLAALATVLFIAAPIWWVPTSWKVTKHPPELHQNAWQLLAGNSFLFAMLAFLTGVAVMLARRSGVLRQRSSPAHIHVEQYEPLFVAPRRNPGPLLAPDATAVDVESEDRDLVGSESSMGPAE
jgi:hypothetical protein